MKTKSNQEYWERRHLQTKVKEIKSTEAYEKALQPELNGLYRGLHAEMEQWYTKYANTNGIDKDEAKKSLSGINTKHWQLTLKQFEEKAKSGGYKDELDSEYYRSRVARLQDLEEQLKQHTQSFTNHRTETMRNGLAKQYGDTYMRSNFNIQASKGAFTSNFARFNEAQLKMVVSNPWGKDGKDFSKRIWKNYHKELPSYLMDAVLRGTIMGWSPAMVSQMFHARFQDIKKGNIHNLVVSEMGHVAEEANAKSYEENEIDDYEYMATLESHTCTTCAGLDGRRFKTSQRIVGVNYPLIHGRCRCTTVPWVEDLPDINERWSRDPTTGKGKMVKDIKFNEWKKLVDAGKEVPVYKRIPLPIPVVTPKVVGIDPMDKTQWPEGVEVTKQPEGEQVNFTAPNGQQVNREWVQKLIRFDDDDDLLDTINYYLGRGRFTTLERNAQIANWIKEVKKFKEQPVAKKVPTANPEPATPPKVTVEGLSGLTTKELIKRGAKSEVDIRRIGESYHDKVINTEYLNRSKELGKLDEKAKQMEERFLRTRLPKDRDLYWDAVRKREDQRIDNQSFMIKHVSKELAKIRPVGYFDKGQTFQKRSSLRIKGMVDEVWKSYPTSWLEQSQKAPMMIKNSSRGYYSARANTLAATVKDDPYTLRRTVQHELGHRMEHINPEIRKMENEFYQRRTANEELQLLSKLTGNHAYSWKEKARPDHFLRSYMGKQYGKGDENSTYELLSMGLESLYSGSNDLTKDKDYATFILGLLAYM